MKSLLCDFPTALRQFRELEQEVAEAGHPFTIRPDLEVRQRRGQQFQ